MSAEKFCLRWNDFEANISTAFRELREDKDFFDVTLACDDDQIQAHKVILSACSPFFRTVLRRNKHDHPLLYFKGVKYTDLLAVLNFMYHGEVNVAQEELNSFLAVAEDLKVKGLTQNGSDKPSNRSDPIPAPKIRPREPPERIDSAPPKRPRPSPQFSTPSSHQTISKPSYQDDDDIQEVVPVKSEPISLIPDPIPPQPIIPAPAVEPVYSAPMSHSTGIVADPNMDNSSMYGDEYADYGNYEEGPDGSYDGSMMAGAATADGNKDLDEQIAKNMEKFLLEDGRNYAWQCTLCGRNNKDKSIVKHHVETHFPGYAQQCPYCQNMMKTRKSLKMHIIREHSGRK
eukprot:GFUD01041543.1.p1 GENE.GFUD01041543.1~~GFUD01041543.1.p1  ORF type:complete len:344 (-),score=71.41 GFUD01041543.1:458-1489(-)